MFSLYAPARQDGLHLFLWLDEENLTGCLVEWRQAKSRLAAHRQARHYLSFTDGVTARKLYLLEHRLAKLLVELHNTACQSLARKECRLRTNQILLAEAWLLAAPIQLSATGPKSFLHLLPELEEIISRELKFFFKGSQAVFYKLPKFKESEQAAWFSEILTNPLKAKGQLLSN